MRSDSKRSALSSTSERTVSGSCRKATLSGASVPPSCSTKISCCHGVQSRISGTSARATGRGAAASRARSDSRSQVSSVTSARDEARGEAGAEHHRARLGVRAQVVVDARLAHALADRDAPDVPAHHVQARDAPRQLRVERERVRQVRERADRDQLEARRLARGAHDALRRGLVGEARVGAARVALGLDLAPHEALAAHERVARAGADVDLACGRRGRAAAPRPRRGRARRPRPW